MFLLASWFRLLENEKSALHLDVSVTTDHMRRPWRRREVCDMRQPIASTNQGRITLGTGIQGKGSQRQTKGLQGDPACIYTLDNQSLVESAWNFLSKQLQAGVLL